jgi:cation transport ATPase
MSMLPWQELLPATARLALGDGSWKDVPAAAVSKGDLLVVLPGDRIPVDGAVTRGRSSVNEAALTGEPLPLPKVAGALDAQPCSSVPLGTWLSIGRPRDQPQTRSQPLQ